MICSACREEISDHPRADNRYRFCEPCGWVLHHGCWIERLSLGQLGCPDDDGMCADGHGDGIGMLGDFSLRG